MFERPRSGEKALLVHVGIMGEGESGDPREFEELARSAGATVVHSMEARRHRADPRLLVGSGKAREIRCAIDTYGVEVVIVDHPLSPSQERNLERELGCRVVDRTGLILDIFAQRARSFEGKLQVELAQLRHLSTRLVRGWSHLERQKGGIGLRGPGETQLETDRRLIGGRIAQLRRRLDKVARQRGQGRRARLRADVPTVSLVGYTNAGKSTLFNALTSAEVYAEDQLFATLDPTLRRLPLGTSSAVVLADTVGFIRHLPHDLVAAFRSTLEETASAALLLHVVDAADPLRGERKCEVQSVLNEIGAGEIPQLEIYNKIDLLAEEHPRIERGEGGRPERIWLSAKDGGGLELLRKALAELFQHQTVRHMLRLRPDDGRLRAQIYRQAARVLEEKPTREGGWEIEAEFEPKVFERLRKKSGGLERRLLGRS